MSDKIVEILKKRGVISDRGLSSEEIEEIEKIYDIQFCTEIRNLYKRILPISKGFYNWRDKGEENIEKIKKVLRIPKEDLLEIASELEWHESYGERPIDFEERKERLKNKINSAINLTPIYLHRYIPQMSEIENPPVFSVYGDDIIEYGTNLEEYFEVEFNNKNQRNLDFENSKEIDFWSKITLYPEIDPLIDILLED